MFSVVWTQTFHQSLTEGGMCDGWASLSTAARLCSGAHSGFLLSCALTR